MTVFSFYYVFQNGYWASSFLAGKAKQLRRGPFDGLFILCVPERVLGIFVFGWEIRVSEIFEMFYPPKGAANADPEWGPIDFYYVLIILSCVLETYLGVSKCALLSAF